MANDTVEVLFAGQPCLTVSEGMMGAVWKINPVFAKLVYGANVFEDIPVCLDGHPSTEAAIAGGLVKLHSLGAFNTEVDLPEDSYADTMNAISEDVKQYTIKTSKNLMESFTTYKKIMESIQSGTFVSPMAFKSPVGSIVAPVDAVPMVEEKNATVNVFDQWVSKKITPIAEVRSEYAANIGLSKAMDSAKQGKPTKKKAWLQSPDGKMLSDHDSEADALRTWKNLSVNKGVKIMRNENVSCVDITDILIAEDVDAQYSKWESDVRAKHPTKQLKFKGRVEQGLHTTSAEESGKDRSYGMWDHDENKGHVFEESEEEEVKEIVNALKKDKKFISKSGKDSK